MVVAFKLRPGDPGVFNQPNVPYVCSSSECSSAMETECSENQCNKSHPPENRKTVSVIATDSGYSSNEKQSSSATGSGSGSGSADNEGNAPSAYNSSSGDSTTSNSRGKQTAPYRLKVNEKEDLAELRQAVENKNAIAHRLRDLTAIALDCLKRLKDSENSGAPLNLEECMEPNALPTSVSLSSSLTTPTVSTSRGSSTSFKETVSRSEECCLLLALEDLSIVSVSVMVSKIIGFPQEMLLSRSIMDFVYPRDQFTVTSEITGHMRKASTVNFSGYDPTSFYIRLREIQSLETGCYDVTNKKSRFKPFQVSMSLQWLNQDNKKTYCLIKLHPMESAFTYPEEVPRPLSFDTRHTAACYFSHVDPAAICFLGYLPQDLIGNSIFDYYHAEDIPSLKRDFQEVVEKHCAPHPGRAARFRAHNGCYMILSTEWSCFVNPWSYRVEFMIGQHKVTKGPSNPAVFADPREESFMDAPMPRKATQLQDEIKQILHKQIGREAEPPSGVGRYLGESVARALTCHSHGSGLRATASGRKAPGVPDKRNVVSPFSSPDEAATRRDGRESANSPPARLLYSPTRPEEGSPYSSTSSNSLPSYHQLNYKANMIRYFASQSRIGNSNTSSGNDTNSSSGGEKQRNHNSSPSSNSHSDQNIIESVSVQGSNGSGHILSEPWKKTGNAADEHGCSPTRTPLTTEILNRHNRQEERNLFAQHKKDKKRGLNTLVDRVFKAYKHTRRGGAHDVNHPVKNIKDQPHRQHYLRQTPTSQPPVEERMFPPGSGSPQMKPQSVDEAEAERLSSQTSLQPLNTPSARSAAQSGVEQSSSLPPSLLFYSGYYPGMVPSQNTVPPNSAGIVSSVQTAALFLVPSTIPSVTPARSQNNLVHSLWRYHVPPQGKHIHLRRRDHRRASSNRPSPMPSLSPPNSARGAHLRDEEISDQRSHKRLSEDTSGGTSLEDILRPVSDPDDPPVSAPPRKEPSWLANGVMTKDVQFSHVKRITWDDIVHRYQLPEMNLEVILAKDRAELARMKQPNLVLKQAVALLGDKSSRDTPKKVSRSHFDLSDVMSSAESSLFGFDDYGGVPGFATEKFLGSFENPRESSEASTSGLSYLAPTHGTGIPVSS
ncbi:unnamed protein product [Cyprideis torosa]|uniref:Period circadian protein n=1 Tax=Cyprideis torosa TaxID=163714 RepID=A0A7R8W8F3_9CRUS|nr:unnamed protein product [Cyprideis torosa]CAG0883158.1 unnamed protein product [Cyprideis torosa]